MLTRSTIVPAKRSAKGNTLLLVCLSPETQGTANMHRDDGVQCLEFDSLLELLFDM